MAIFRKHQVLNLLNKLRVNRKFEPFILGLIYRFEGIGKPQEDSIKPVQALAFVLILSL
jgi:hypothetical protein